MQSYTVLEPPGPSADRFERAERLVFVKDGFSATAAIFAPVWLLAHRLWLAFGAYLVAAVLLGLLAALPGRAGDIGGWLLLALHVLIGFEAGAIRRWTLGRAGSETIASVSGRNRNECERRFFEAWLKDQPFIGRGPGAGTGSPASPSPTGAGTGGRLSASAFEPRRA